MFGKKILSIIGLIFLGSQLASAEEAAEEQICSATYANQVCTPSNCNESDKNKLLLASGSGDDTNKYIAKIEYEDNQTKCSLKTGNDEGEDLCVDDTTKIILGRAEEYCNGSNNNCDSYVSCNTEGVCTDTTTKYTKRTSGGQTGGGEVITPPPTCNTDAELIAGGDACADKKGKYYFIASAKDKTETNLADVLTLSTDNKGYLYECNVADNGETSCEEKTDLAGYFESQNDDYTYIQCTPADDNATTCIGLQDTGLSATCTNAGELIKVGDTYKICVQSSNDVVYTGVDFTKASYFVNAAVTSAFNDKPLAVNGNDHYYVVVNIDEKSAVVDRTATPKKYRYAVAASKKIVEKADASTSGICERNAFKNDVGHEFEMTIPAEGAAVDNVNYYRDLTVAKTA